MNKAKLKNCLTGLGIAGLFYIASEPTNTYTIEDLKTQVPAVHQKEAIQMYRDEFEKGRSFFAPGSNFFSAEKNREAAYNHTIQEIACLD